MNDFRGSPLFVLWRGNPQVPGFPGLAGPTARRQRYNLDNCREPVSTTSTPAAVAQPAIPPAYTPHRTKGSSDILCGQNQRFTPVLAHFEVRYHAT